MPRHIIKLGGKYLVWSTICDAPVTYGSTLEEVREYWRLKYGEDGIRELPSRLERVEEKGTSAFDDQSVDETVWLNRAGARESCMTIPQLIAYYVNGGPDKGEHATLPVGDNWPGPKWELRHWSKP